jgi:IS1 family transposase
MNTAVPINDVTAFLHLYFQARNCQKWGWVSYKVYAKLIRYATGKKDTEEIRKLWQDLFATGCFEKRKIKSSTEYRFKYSLP